MTVESEATDRIAVGMMILMVVVTVLWFAMVISYGVQGAWIAASLAALVSLVFILQIAMWWVSRKARIRIDQSSITRLGHGPRRWTVALTEVTASEIREVRGAPYLVLTLTTPRRHGRLDRLLLDRSLPDGALVSPLAPTAVTEVQRVLDQLRTG